MLHTVHQFCWSSLSCRIYTTFRSKNSPFFNPIALLVRHELFRYNITDLLLCEWLHLRPAIHPGERLFVQVDGCTRLSKPRDMRDLTTGDTSSIIKTFREALRTVDCESVSEKPV